MTPLIDCDVLFYEIGFSSEQRLKVGNNYIVVPRSWEFAKELFDKKVGIICKDVGATTDPILFLTNTPFITKLENRRRKWEGLEPIEFQEVFRHKIAVTKPYKGTRKEEKPYHFKNLVSYVLNTYDTQISFSGLEADDLMCIYQTAAPPDSTIICSRDKDLRQCEGWHYSWECGLQASIGPLKTNKLGSLINTNEGKINKKTGKPMPLKVFGTGDKFFYYQLLIGDTVDSITGIHRKGPVFAFNLLKNAESGEECLRLVREAYAVTGEGWETRLKEMADLAYMIRYLKEDGEPLLCQI